MLGVCFPCRAFLIVSYSDEVFTVMLIDHKSLWMVLWFRHRQFTLVVDPIDIRIFESGYLLMMRIFESSIIVVQVLLVLV